MALFTLYYERNNIDECGSAIEKRKLVLQSLMQKVEGEIKFELFKTPDGKRYKANIIVMNNVICDRVINILHRVEKAVDFPERMMISEVISLIVGLPVDSIGGNVEPIRIDDKVTIFPGDKELDFTLKYQHPEKVDKETNIGIPVVLTKRSLEQLMDLLPVDIPYSDESGPGTISFALEKGKAVESHKQNHVYTCGAFWTDELHASESNCVFMNSHDDNYDLMQFEADDPGDAIAMMIGHLKYNKLI